MKREASERGYKSHLFVFLCLLAAQLFSSAMAAPFLASAVIPNGSAIQIVRGEPTVVIANAGTNNVSLYSAADNSFLGTVNSIGQTPIGVAIKPTGDLAFVANGGDSGGNNASLAVINLNSKSLQQSITGLGLGSQTVTVDPSGTRAFVGNVVSGTVSILDISGSTATLLGTVGSNIYAQGMVTSPDGRRLYVASSPPGNATGEIVVINVATQAVIARVPSGGFSPTGVAMNSSGTRLYVTNAGQRTSGVFVAFGSVAIFDVSTDTPVGLKLLSGSPGITNPQGVALTNDGNTLFVANSSSNTVSRINVADPANASVVATFSSQGGFPVGLSLNPDNSRLYVANRNANAVAVFDTSNSSYLLSLAAGSSPLSYGNFVSAGAITSPPAQTFGAIINGGDQTAVNCGVSLNSNVPVDVSYRAISGATQTFTYTQPTNVPVNVGPGQAQVFFLTFTPRTTFAPSDIAFNFSCDNAASAKVVPTLNTFVMSANATPVPNMVALVNTTLDGNPNEDADLDMYNGSGQFIVASASIGAAGTVRVSAAPYSGFISAAPSISVCELVPNTQNCVAAPGPYVDVNVTAGSISSPGSTPAFKFFVTENGPIADSPEQNRIIVRFYDTSGAIRGATQTSVRSK